MKKRLLGTLVCAFAVLMMLCLAGCTNNNPEEFQEVKTIELEGNWSANGMTVSYPSSWETKEADNLLGGEIYFYPPDGGELYVDASKSLGDNYSSVPSAETLESYANEYCDGMNDDTSGNSFDVNRNFRITDKGDMVSLVSPMTSTINGANYSGYFYMAFNSDSRFYVAMMVVPEDQLSDMDEIMREIVENIEID